MHARSPLEYSIKPIIKLLIIDPLSASSTRSINEVMIIYILHDIYSHLQACTNMIFDGPHGVSFSQKWPKL